MNKKEIIAFDLDGTLVDSLNASGELVQQAILQLTGQEVKLELIFAHFGQPEDMVFKTVSAAGHLPVDPELMLQTYLKKMEERHDLFPLFSDIDVLLKETQNQSRGTALYTARGRHATEIILRRRDLARYFDFVLTGNDVHQYKPHPEGLLKIAQYFKAQPEDLTYIGDSPADISMAKTIGSRAIAAFWKRQNPLVTEEQRQWMRENANHHFSEVAQLVDFLNLQSF